jgi:hypothetical protein
MKLRVDVGDGAAKFELLTAISPQAADALGRRLPLDTSLVPSKWSGRAAEIVLPGWERIDLEHPVCSIYSGWIGLDSIRGVVLMAYGAAEYRSVLGVEYATLLGRVVAADRAWYLRRLASIHDEGAIAAHFELS